MASVLLIEPSRMLAQLHAAELGVAGHDVTIAHSVEEARGCLADGAAEAVVSAVDMAPPGGYGLLRELRADPRTSDLPFIFLSSHPADVVRARAGGCWIDGVAPKSVPGALPAALRDVLRPAGSDPGDEVEGTILLVDDSAVTRAVVRTVLEAAGLHVIEAADGTTALDLAVRTAPDAVVLDIHMPGRDGLAVLGELRATEATAGLPVVMLTASDGTDTLVSALAAGAEDFLGKSRDPRELVARLRGVIRRRRSSDVAARRQVELEVHASVDRLTGLVTRGQAEAMVARSTRETEAAGAPLSLLLIDLDHFKAINDTHGHAAGDQVLAAVGARILAVLRTGDIAARWGGEEILVALPGADAEVAARRGEDIRRAIAAEPVLTIEGPLAVTASIGVAPVRDGDVERALGDADAALYAAKRGGRDRVTAHAA